MRLRSRWLKIAVVVLILVGGLWWLTRPKTDPRFVAWEYFQTDSEGVESLNPDHPLGTLTFGADGRAREDDDEASVGWQISGKKLYLTPLPNSLDESIQIGKYAINQLAQGSLPEFTSTMEIRSVGEQRIVLRPGDEAEEDYIVLKRVSAADPIR